MVPRPDLTIRPLLGEAPMDEFQLNFVVEVMPVTRRHARIRFRKGTPDRRAKIDDSVAFAWETYVAARGNPRATPSTIATIAVRRVASRRRFPHSARDIEGCDPSGTLRACRVEFDVELAFGEAGNPADLAILRIDFKRWMRRLKPKHRKVCQAVLAGFTTTETAKLIGCTAARISQIRRELVKSWESFTA
jgi:hypothetical protein